MLEIVTFQNEYRDAVVNVILPIQQEEFNIPISLEGQPDLLDVASFYQSGHGNFWVAKIDDKVVGTVGLLDIGNGQAALRKMFVKSEYRGSTLKVAYNLLKTLVEWCLSEKVETIFLGTTAKFLAAHRFYEKNGFREVSKDQLPSTFPIMAVDTKFYQRLVK